MEVTNQTFNGAYLPHVNRNLTALPDDTGSILPLHPLLEVRKNLGCRNATKGLGSLVANHLGFMGILEHLEKSRDGMGREELAEHKRNLVPRPLRLAWVTSIKTTRDTCLNRALSSAKPDASASTAAGVPIFRRANIARYLSNRGRFVSFRVFWSLAMFSSDASSGAALPARRPEVGGAGSIEV